MTDTSGTFEKITSVVNYPFTYDSVKILMLLISGTFIGYTLFPVPGWLETLFYQNIFFKFLVLFFSAIIALHPIDRRKLLYSIIFSITVLTIYEFARVMGKIIKTKKKHVTMDDIYTFMMED